MATVEFQLSTQAFLKAQRNALLQRMACPPAPFAITRADGTALLNVVIDRIELGAAALDHNQEEEFAIFGTGSGSESGDIVFKDNAKGFKVQMTQELTVHVTTLEDILSRPDQPPAIVVPVSGKLVFDISAFAGPDGLIYMRIDFDQTGSSITVPPGGSGIPVDWDKVNGAVMAELDSRLPSLTIPIGLQDLAQGSKFINAGASVDSTGSRLAIRGDTALHIPPAMLFVWDAFHKGNFDDRLDGNEWALFVDGKFLGAIIDAKIDGGLMELPSEVEVLPRTTYSNVGGKAVFSVGLDINVDPGGIAGDVLDALPGLVGNGHMELQLPVELKLGSPTDLVAEVDMTTIQAQATPFLGIVGMMIDFWGVSLQGFLDFAARSILSGE